MKVPWVTVPLGAGALTLIAGVNGPLAQMSEMDGFDKAVTSGSKEDALAFINDFRSSHLIPDLIELLPPDTAAAVCADLPSGASSTANRACDEAKAIIATAPAAGTAAPEVVTPEEAPPAEDLSAPPAAPTEAVTTADVGLQRDTPGNQSSTGSRSGDTSGTSGSSSGGSSSGGSSSGGSSSGGSTSGGSTSGGDGSSSGGSTSGGSSSSGGSSTSGGGSSGGT